MKTRDLLESILDYEDRIGGVDDALEGLSDQILSVDVTHIEHDHNRVDDKAVFVAISGTTTDSHAFIEDARQKKAGLVVGQRSRSAHREPDMTVDSTRAIIGPLTSSLYGQPSRKMKLVGITGTNGKTTCSYLYTSMVQAQKFHCFTMGTTGIYVDGEKEADSQTTPDPVIIHKFLADFLLDDVTYGAMEVSSHALDQDRVLGVRFSAVAFTNFTQDHLDYHESMDDYFRAKMLLFSKTYSNRAVINIDGDTNGRVREVAMSADMEIITVSCKDKNAMVYVHPGQSSLNGTSLSVHVRTLSGDQVYEVVTPLIAQFNIENIAVALGLALATELDLSIAVKILENPLTVPGRLERPERSTPFSVFVDYAHTPDALERVLATLKPLSKKLIVVFGCGGDRDHVKRPMMGRVAHEYADQIIVTNDNPRSENPRDIANEILMGIPVEAQVELDRRLAIKRALEQANDGDAVVIAGKGHEYGQEFADHTEAFSDMDVVTQLIDEMELV